MRRHLEDCRLCLNGVRIIDANHLGGGQGRGVMVFILNSTKENQYFILSHMFDPTGMIYCTFLLFVIFLGPIVTTAQVFFNYSGLLKR